MSKLNPFESNKFVTERKTNLLFIQSCSYAINKFGFDRINKYEIFQPLFFVVLWNKWVFVAMKAGVMLELIGDILYVKFFAFMV